MRIDSSHKKWAIVITGAFAVATVAYWSYRPSRFSAPFGGTPAGMIFGISGALLMLIAFVLNLRKFLPVWYRGPAQRWMRSHIWLGLLSYPLILFHSAFKAGGTLTYILMWIFPIVIVTGVLGAIVQHVVPRLMTETIDEGIHSQIEYLKQKLAERADRSLQQCRQRLQSGENKDEEISSQIAVAMAAPAQMLELSDRYEGVIKPYLTGRGGPEVDLSIAHGAEVLFERWRIQLPELRGTISEWEEICREKRDLDRQKRLHFFLHSWLVVHIPLSILLVVLGAVHAVMAFYYLNWHWHN